MLNTFPKTGILFIVLFTYEVISLIFAGICFKE
nr:MAG TPA: hypothetical protein [Caudoviricetes sp.]